MEFAKTWTISKALTNSLTNNLKAAMANCSDREVAADSFLAPQFHLPGAQLSLEVRPKANVILQFCRGLWLKIGAPQP